MIRQRVLYVGIGGTGLDLGLELEKAFRREICGLNGMKLLSGSNQGLQPNELPSFVQFLFVDFAQEALQVVSRSIKEKNVTSARMIVPTIDNYPAVAEDLRLNMPNQTSWLPSTEGEPQTKPLNAGAGQFPTVGRAALFSAIKSQGYEQTLGSDIKNALRKLDDSIGELKAYQDSSSSSITVYVGFSLSGGTGCGIFLDVLQLLVYELYETLGGNKATVIPVVFMPSTFDGMDKELVKRGKLNAAPAILDISRLMAWLHNADSSRADEFTIDYPTLGKVNIDYQQGGADVPVVSIVSKGVMSREDCVRSIAASIVAQVSAQGSVVNNEEMTTDNVTNRNTFIEDLINFRPDTSESHALGLGTKPLMPTMAASLTVPSDKVADIISKRLVSEGLNEIKNKIALQEIVEKPELVDDLLEWLNLEKLTLPEVFTDATNLRFILPKEKIKSEKELESKIALLRNRIETAKTIITEKATEEVSSRTSFDFSRSFQDFVKKNSSLSIHECINIGHSVLRKLETETGLGATSGTKSTKRSGGKLPVFLKKLDSRIVSERYKSEEEKFKDEVRNIWWRVWRTKQNLWLNSVENGKQYLRKLETELDSISNSCTSTRQNDVAELVKSSTGLVNFFPDEGSTKEAALDKLYTRTIERLRQLHNLDDQSKGALLCAVAGAQQRTAWGDLVESLRNREVASSIREKIISPVRMVVTSAMSTKDGQSGTMKSLNELLVDAAQDPNTATAASLIQKLGSLVPDQMIPTGKFVRAKVLISYPGVRNPEIEKLILETVSIGGAFTALINLPNSQVVFEGTESDGDVLTVNVNAVAQGLLDNSEIREILNHWVGALVNPNEQKLPWRQRRGFKDLDRLLSDEDRERVVSALLMGLIGETIEVVEGTIENPTKVRILTGSKNAPSSLTETVVDIEPLDGFSSWPMFVAGYERLILSIDPQTTMQHQVVERFLKYIPEQAQTDAPVISKNFRDVVALRETEIEKLRLRLEDRDRWAELAVQRYESALLFWERTFSSVMDKNIDGGKGLRTLAAIMEQGFLE